MKTELEKDSRLKPLHASDKFVEFGLGRPVFSLHFLAHPNMSVGCITIDE
jgi:hypothetical protein